MNNSVREYSDSPVCQGDFYLPLSWHPSTPWTRHTFPTGSMWAMAVPVLAGLILLQLKLGWLSLWHLALAYPFKPKGRNRVTLLLAWGCFTVNCTFLNPAQLWKQSLHELVLPFSVRSLVSSFIPHRYIQCSILLKTMDPHSKTAHD